ncbi:MAG: carboxylating nicotinate-nucleotide diphosphorylase, partial [Pseudomonadota bacterium]
MPNEISLSPQLLAAAQQNVRDALAEDVGSGDVSAALIDPATTATARVITRDDGVLCGQAWADATAAQVSPAIQLHWQVTDADRLTAGQVLFEATGPAHALLTAERTMLNFLQLLSGTATRVARYVSLIGDSNTQLLDTRKTIPGLRLAQKHAVRCGGGNNHRVGLFDAYLLKENHIAAAGSISAAIVQARQLRPDLQLEVEVETLTQLDEALTAGADVIMLDNFSLDATYTAVTRAQGRAKLEASGGIDEQSITDIAAAGVDYISIGDLTKTVMPLDLSM